MSRINNPDIKAKSDTPGDCSKTYLPPDLCPRRIVNDPAKIYGAEATWARFPRFLICLQDVDLERTETMKNPVLASLAASTLLATGLPAMAAPQLPITTSPSIVEKARHDCRWVDNRWTERRGDKVIVCRPHRPSGRHWIWHREGNRFGWWNSQRRVWHYNAW